MRHTLNSGSSCCVALYEPVDILWHHQQTYQEDMLFCTFTSPSSKARRVPCFVMGKNQTCTRVFADEEGVWTYQLQQESGTFECVRKEGKGIAPLQISPDGHGFCKQRSLHPIFLMGYECDWLFALAQEGGKQEELHEFLNCVKNSGFNQLYVNLYAHDTEWCEGNTIAEDYGPPRLYPFMGSNDAPNFTHVNEAFFECFDRMMDETLANELYVALYFKVFNKLVAWPEKHSKEEERFFQYIVARYEGYPNIMWDFAKEAYYEVEKEYVHAFYEMLTKLDAFAHLKTIHDDKIFCENQRYRSQIDCLTTQQHFDGYTTALFQRERYRMPIIASEFGYECGLEGTQDLSYMYGQTPEEYVKRAYEMVMAGAYPVYYYTYTAWDILLTKHKPKGYLYWKNMRAYFEDKQWHRFSPDPTRCCWRGRCLSAGSGEYLYMIDPDEHALFYVESDYTRIEVEWFDMYANEKQLVIYQRGEIETRNDTSLIVIRNPYKGMWAMAHVRCVWQ